MNKKNILLGAILAFAGATFLTACDDISEDGYSVVKPGELTLSASLDQKEFGYEGADGNVQIKANTKWTASTEATWITLAASSGAGNSELAFTVSPNTNTSGREGIIVIASTEAGVPSQTLNVSQGFTNLTVSKNNLVFEQTGGEEEITVTSSSSWTAYCDADYLTVTPGESAQSGATTVKISCTPNNTVSTRIYTIQFQSTDDNGTTSTAEVNVVQQGSLFGFSASTRTVGAINGTAEFNITADMPWTLSVDQGSSWCSVSTRQGDGNASVIITAADNDEAAQRTATITLTAVNGTETSTLAVIQEAAPVDMQTTVVEVIYRDYVSVIVGYTVDPDVDVTRRGVVYTLATDSENPNLANGTVITDVQSDEWGRFRAEVPGLSPATSYVVRGFVTIEAYGRTKTYYGPASPFTTKSNPSQDDNPNPTNP